MQAGPLHAHCFYSGAIEPAELVLGGDTIPWLRHELAHHLGVPGITNQDVALGAIQRDDPFANVNPFMGDRVSRVDGTKIREVRAEFHLEVDDLGLKGAVEQKKELARLMGTSASL